MNSLNRQDCALERREFPFLSYKIAYDTATRFNWNSGSFLLLGLEPVKGCLQESWVQTLMVAITILS